jgi:2-keto-4-pentenoate hydratase
VSPEEIEGVARRMLSDVDARRPNALFAERGGAWLTLADAYAVQRAVAALRVARGEQRAGYKVGCVSAAIQQQFGLDQPVWSVVWQNEVHRSGCRLRADCYPHLAVEGEIALRLRRDVPAETRDPAALADCMACGFPVIELHRYVFRGPVPTSQELVAGNAMHAGVVLPSPLGGQPFDAWSRAEIRLEIDGRLEEVAKVDAVPGGPLASVRWLAAALAREGECLRAGELVLTGSPGRLIPVGPGSVVTVTGAGLRVELCVTAGEE